MAWSPIALTVPQYVDSNGTPYSGAVLKAYASGTSTPISMATDSAGGTTAASIALNASGYPAVSGNVVIPHVAQAYKLSLYPTQAAADANSGAIWTIDALGVLAASDGSTLVGFLQSGTGAVATTVQAVLRKTVRVSDFGAVGDGTTDDTVAIRAAATYTNSIGGGTLEFEYGKTYKIWSTSLTALMSFASGRDFVIAGNGAKLVSAQVNGSTLNVIQVSACRSIRVEDLELVGGNTLDSASYAPGTVPRSNVGETMIAVSGGCDNVTLLNVKASNCLYGLSCSSASAVAATPIKSVSILGFVLSGVYYGMLFAYAGDNVFGRGIRSTNSGRVYFAYNVHDHDMEIDSQHGGPFSDCLLKVYASSTAGAYNELRNIRLVYRTDGRFTGAAVQNADEGLVAVDLQQNDVSTASAYLENVDIKIDATAATPATTANAFIIRRYDSASAGDSDTGRAHRVRNLKIGGLLRTWQNATQGGVKLFVPTTAGAVTSVWTGDQLNLIKVDGLNVQTSNTSQENLQISGQGFLDTTQSAILDNIQLDGQLTFTNITTGMVDIRAVKSANITSLSGRPVAYTPVWGVASGSTDKGTGGTLVGVYQRKGNRCTATVKLVLGTGPSLGAGAWTFSVPFAGAITGYDWLGSAVILDSGTTYYLGTALLAGTNSTVQVYCNALADVIGSASSPCGGGWAVGDYVEFTIDYPLGLA